MKFHIITIFPDSFKSYFEASILKIAQEKKVFIPVIYNLCDYSVVNTRRIDDRPFWWLPWTIFSPEPLAAAIDSIIEKNWNLEVIYLSPRWKVINPALLEKFARSEKDCILICWHYEGIDQRIIDHYKIKEISIWKYVLTSWELAAMVLIDWIVRLIPWVISDESLKEESFSLGLQGKKEYPQYTRPQEWRWRRVPDELISWDPKKIVAWKKKFL
ncbi:MAG: tRNA (guanine-N(1)-)-methyltransferase [uncultured bacterium (gcode 4)]|uniref:tRNA (guanine-N(1)-)-methyltransferase n=1 Tax=uncultured bacterium (gcode 4) TaxID=1234023 RepID=K2G4C3_9BACT|nr:MAG: tRNA (guanine-N(1)-)-methyltransferase [uncultured bacterium (gcode 4)]